MIPEIMEKSAEQRIQYIFKTQNESTNQRLNRVGYLLEKDSSPIVRHEAAYVLGEINSPKSFEFLKEAILTDNNKFVVHEAALAISNLGDKQAEQILQNLLSHPDSDVVLTAIIALERLRMKLKNEKIDLFSANSILLDLNSDPEHRIQASFLLMGEGSIESINTLIQALKVESDPIVKHEIIFSLGETASKLAYNALISEIEKDKNHFVVHETLLALSTLGYEDAKETIQRFVHHEVDEIRESAEIALERLFGVESID